MALFFGVVTLRVTSGDDNFFETLFAGGASFYDPDKSRRNGGGASEGNLETEGPSVHEVLMKNAQHLPNEIITEPLSGP